MAIETAFLASPVSQRKEYNEPLPLLCRCCLSDENEFLYRSSYRVVLTYKDESRHWKTGCKALLRVRPHSAVVVRDDYSGFRCRPFENGWISCFSQPNLRDCPRIKVRQPSAYPTYDSAIQIFVEQKFDCTHVYRDCDWR